MKAHELDTVELLTDLPEFNILRGERAVVLDAYQEPEELYDLELVDNNGTSSRFAYLVKPEQILNIDLEAKKLYERGIALLNEGNLLEASRAFRHAIELRPSYIRGLHESLRTSTIPFNDYEHFIDGLFMVRLLDPTYEIAKQNRAITYLNHGVEEAKRGNFAISLHLFHSALRASDVEEIILKVKENISATFSKLGAQAHKERDFATSLRNFEMAYAYNTTDRTRQDLALAYVYLADHFMELDKYREAIILYQNSEDAGLINAGVYNNHAVALATLQEFELAIMIFESALALAPDDSTIQANLSNALTKNITVLKHEIYNLSFNPIPPLQSAEQDTSTYT
jgi:tetratricopeptide (TPR) repeat protein